jgi:hypothetical protein
MSVQAISGPAGADNEDVGPFEWNEKWSDYSHVEEKFPKENFRVNREMRNEILVYDLFLTKF